jgi:Zn-dependent protease with chaperone function
MENEAQLAIVLAHEIAHVTERHMPKGIQAADRIQLLTIENLPDLARLKVSKVELKRGALDLLHLIEKVISLLPPQLEAKGQCLVLEV